MIRFDFLMKHNHLMSVLDVHIMPISLKLHASLHLFPWKLCISTLHSVPIAFLKILAVILVVDLNHPWEPCQGFISSYFGRILPYQLILVYPNL